MWNSIVAEVLLLRKRLSTWILLGVWTIMHAVFGYVFPYVIYLNGDAGSAGLPAGLTPARLVGTFLEGYPFFGGVIALMLGVLAFGSEYGWGTWKTLYTQGPGRLHLFLAKLGGLAFLLAGFVLVTFAVDSLFSYALSLGEGAPIDWPGVSSMAQGLVAGWFLMAVWASFGAPLAVLSKGTSLAIGIGILYGLVIEGLISAFVNSVSALRSVAEAFLRANGYSLVQPLGVGGEAASSNGPGAFSGPYVGGEQAVAVLAAYLVGFLLLSALLLRRRDVT
ncbi:MAG: ABC transporter permease [Thermoleophilia bacterium]|nr:ABC transporter permease [Thermoleophilia bacterium]